ncbi:SAF domain-containing protein [Xylariomycetidae sp. FL2044]|nr:SAF domain-containing protein [Xylariomycetidae sp. FL2044]
MTRLPTKLAELKAAGKPAYLNRHHRPSTRRAQDRTGFPAEKKDDTVTVSVPEDSTALITSDVGVTLGVTGHPAIDIRHALHGCKHNGPARKAKAAGIIQSMACGGQPALIANMGSPRRQVLEALEMETVANGCNLTLHSGGCKLPSRGVWDLLKLLKPTSDGGQLNKKGKYGPKAGNAGRYAKQYKPDRVIGLELGVSTANSIAAKVVDNGVAAAKRDLQAVEKLDDEEGFMLYGRLMTAADSMEMKGLPTSLTHGVAGKREDIEYSDESQAISEFESKKADGVNVVHRKL